MYMGLARTPSKLSCTHIAAGLELRRHHSCVHEQQLHTETLLQPKLALPVELELLVCDKDAGNDAAAGVFAWLTF